MTTTHPYKPQAWITAGTVGDTDDLLTPVNLSLVLQLLQAQGQNDRISEQVKDLKQSYLRELWHEGEPLCFAETGAPILEPSDDWQAEPEAFRSYCLELSNRERAAGIKPASMGDEYCPALVARNRMIVAERALIDATAPVFGIRPASLTLEKAKEWCELVTELLLVWAREQGAI